MSLIQHYLDENNMYNPETYCIAKEQILLTKQKQLQQLQYECQLIQQDIVQHFKTRLTTEISNQIDLFEVWQEHRPKFKIRKRNRTTYDLFFELLRISIFKDIWNDIKINPSIVNCNYNTCYEVPFIYKNQTFRLAIPVIETLKNYNDIPQYYYRIAHQDGEHSWYYFKRYFTQDQAKDNIKKDLDDYLQTLQKE